MLNQVEFVNDDDFSKMGIRCEAVHTTELDEWIKQKHYLKSVPCGARLRLAFKDKTHRLLGAMMLCRPARKLDQWKIIDFARVCFEDDTQPFVESHCLSLARKYIRKHMPEIKGVIAYHSTGEGHKGTIYDADGWYQLGVTHKPPSWENRPGRTDRDRSDKIRWTRSP